MHLVKRGVQIAIGPLGPSRFFLQKVVASTGSNLARLGELGGKLLPYFAINRRKGAVPKIPKHLGHALQLFLGEKNCFREQNPSLGAFVTLPRCFREQIREGFLSFFIRSLFVLRSSTDKFSNPRLSIHFLFCWLSSLVHSLSVFFSSIFLTSFNRSFNPLSRLINDKMNFNRSFAL